MGEIDLIDVAVRDIVLRAANHGDVGLAVEGRAELWYYDGRRMLFVVEVGSEVSDFIPALLGVPENILAVDRGYNELLFVGDIVNFPQNAIGVATKRIQDNPDEVYGMVRAALRALYFALEPRNRDEVINIVMKQWKLPDRRIATEMLRQFNRGMARELMAKPEGMQLMIDLVREDSKVTLPFTISQVVDYSFVEKARRDLGSSR